MSWTSGSLFAGQGDQNSPLTICAGVLDNELRGRGGGGGGGNGQLGATARQIKLQMPTPVMGFRTEGKPTCAAAAGRSAGEWMRMFLGDARPAWAMTARVCCFSLAASTALGGFPGSPRASASRETRA